MVLEPSRRTFSEEVSGRKVKDVDAAARAQRLHAIGWSVYAGVPLGLVVGSLMGYPLAALLTGPLLVYLFAVLLAHSAGKASSVLNMPSGASTPRKKEYSRARALEIRGAFQEAIESYEVEILKDPAKGEPYLRIARIHRDGLRKPEEAVKWFRRAQREAELHPGERIRVHRETAELFLHHLKEPRRAAPELARLAESHPATSHGRWAAAELAEIKAEMAGEDGPG